MFDSILFSMLTIIFYAAVFGFFALIVYFLLSVFSLAVKLHKSPLRFTKRRFQRLILIRRFFKPVDFLKWVLVDIFRGRDRSRLFGIWAFTGYFGQGKSLGMVTFARQLQKQHSHKKIRIFANFKVRGQSGLITCWEDLLHLPKNSIVIFDEIQSTFTSQKFKDFPIDLLWKLTQCRKQGLMVLCSTPVFHRMVIQLRENVDYIVTSKNVFTADRFFSYNFYRAPEFERYQENPVRLRLAREFNVSFVASDYDYSFYDTTQIVDRFDIVSKENKPIVQLPANSGWVTLPKA